ncbi:MAG: flavodoxin, partial [Prevotella sp.]|nr:flavodoxin [Prevotella sp.]
SYMTCIEEAKKELREQARPEVKNPLDSIDQYDTIILGYPNWWGTMPMVCYTFLESYDFTGKTIIPFCTNEGSGMGSSERFIKKLCPTATVLNGTPIHGAEAANADHEVQSIVNLTK